MKVCLFDHVILEHIHSIFDSVTSKGLPCPVTSGASHTSGKNFLFYFEHPSVSLSIFFFFFLISFTYCNGMFWLIIILSFIDENVQRSENMKG